MIYNPEYISLQHLLNKAMDPEAPMECSSARLDDDIIESFLIPSIAGYFAGYEDLKKIAMLKRINASRVHNLDVIEKKFGGLPISQTALDNIRKLVPELLPIHIPNEYYRYEDEGNEIYYEPNFGTSIFLDEFVISDLNAKFLFYKGKNKELEYQFYSSISAIINSLKSGTLEAKYFDPKTNKMESIDSGFWYSEHREILWLKGKIMIKEKYVECFVTSESSDEFLKSIVVKKFEKKILSGDEADNNDQVIESLFAEDNQIAKEIITKQNIDNIKDSFSFRVFKLALICDSLGYRKATNETLADFIFYTQDWYFDGTHKTITLAKKAASMVRAIDAAKGGVAQDLRKYDHKTKKII